jgi:hypothetical protein
MLQFLHIVISGLVCILLIWTRWCFLFLVSKTSTIVGVYGGATNHLSITKLTLFCDFCKQSAKVVSFCVLVCVVIPH